MRRAFIRASAYTILPDKGNAKDIKEIELYDAVSLWAREREVRVYHVRTKWSLFRTFSLPTNSLIRTICSIEGIIEVADKRDE